MDCSTERQSANTLECATSEEMSLIKFRCQNEMSDDENVVKLFRPVESRLRATVSTQPTYGTGNMPSETILREDTMSNSARQLLPNLHPELQVEYPSILRNSIMSTKSQQSAQGSVELHDGSTQLLLSNLPYDAMHCIASFLMTSDWSSMSLSSKDADKACRTVFRRVRMHGFRCATEVISAWTRGEHADARELASLYVRSGVPIYAPCQGHAFHTIMWRMSREARDMENSAGNSPENDENVEIIMNERKESSDVKLDRFYADRYEARDHGGYFLSSLTYLQEKSLFCRYQTHKDEDLPANPTSRRFPAHPMNQALPQDINGALLQHMSPHQREQQLRRQIFLRERGTVGGAAFHRPMVQVKIHRHLANQHILGIPLCSDEDINLLAGPISLSADFFHPTSCPVFRRGLNNKETSQHLDCENGDFQSRQEGLEEISHEQNIVLENGRGLGGFLHNLAPLSILEPLRHPISPGSVSSSMLSPTNNFYPDITVDVYNAAETNDKLMSEMMLNLQLRFQAFQHKLSTFLNKNDSNNFDECLLDFWDEFFPKTAGIHFFDRHTPVPRLSKLRSFLTEPCPKAVGIVQCEIERIRSPRSKRQSIKGRMFPTYEYRLFIRDRRSNEGGTEFQKRDTVLMTAKNRGKNYHGVGQAVPTRRGVNNYYLYMQDSDTKCTLSQNEHSAEMGRLQSNFICTEFQIFNAHQGNKQSCPSSTGTASESETETEVETGSNSSNPFLPWSSLSLLAQEKDREVGKEESQEHSSEVPLSRRKKNKKIRRRRSKTWQASLSGRTSRRVDTSDRSSSSTTVEDEDGVITYTANLLGNRPRVMDVCIPKVSEDGTECEWRQYIRTSNTPESNRMLSCFKQLQERLNTQDIIEPVNNDDTLQDYGLLALQNRPPWWNIELGAFVLNFGGRVSVASVKNFQLCDRNDQEYIMLQFGRIAGRHSFTMDFQYPLTAVQAFAIAISSLQSKISLG